MSSCIFQLSIFIYALFSDLEQQLQALPAVAIQNIQVDKLFAIFLLAVVPVNLLS